MKTTIITFALLAPVGWEDETGFHYVTHEMKKLTLLGIGLALAMQASAQIANPWQQQFALTPSPNQTPSYVFYIGTNAGSPLVRVALTNASWTTATNDIIAGIYKTNLFPGLTNYVTATAMDTNGIESVPSNEIHFVPPRSPTLKLTAEILQSSEASGPWSLFTNLPPIELVADGHRRFYQARMKVQ